jgi:glycosyltransferase involved in cell wall biosynthesis
VAERRAIWVSTSTQTRGGIATYVREFQRTPLWNDWNIRHVSTHRDGSKVAKLTAFFRGALLFVVELVWRRPEVIHLHSSADASFIRKAFLLWISQPLRVPVIVHMHGSNFEDYFQNSPSPIRRVIGRTLSQATAVIALGEVWADRLRCIAPAARIAVIPNAVPAARRIEQPSQGEPVHVVFLGRIGERKGTFTVLDAWAKLLAANDFGTDPSNIATLTIAGDGEVSKARQRIRDLALDEVVTVREWLSPEEVADLLDRAHVLILPSRNEGQPMAVLEAMARGLCIISSDVGGLAEMVGGGCGLIVPPDDVDAIAGALSLAIHDAELRSKTGAAAHARFSEKFDLDTVAGRIDTLYREIT